MCSVRQRAGSVACGAALLVAGAFVASAHAAGGGFADTGGLVSASDGHTATLLQNGQVLVTGGTRSSGGQNTLGIVFVHRRAELFDPSTGGFTRTGDLGAGRRGHTATRLQTAEVLVAGGGTLRAELFDPDAGAFVPTGDLGTRREGHTSTLLNSGRVLLAGGGSETAEVFDPVAGTFGFTGSLMTPRSRHTATLLADGRVLVVGGSDAAGERLASAELFDPAAGTFTPTGSLTVAREAHTATLLSDGSVLVVGGTGASGVSLASAEVFDPALAGFRPVGGLTAARSGHAATPLRGGRVLISGGGTAGGPAWMTGAEEFVVAKGTFTPTGSLGVARTRHSATLLDDGRVLVAGGIGDCACGEPRWNSLASAEVYSANTGVSVADARVVEGTGDSPGVVDVTVSLDQRHPDAVRVRVSTESGTAVSPADFEAVDRVVEVPAGASSVKVGIAVVRDSVDEPDETFTVRLNDVADASPGVAPNAVLLRDRATVTIADDDEPAPAPVSPAAAGPANPGPEPKPAPPASEPPVAAQGGVPLASAAEMQLVSAPASVVATALGLPSPRRCESRRRFSIRVREPRGVPLASVALTVQGRTVRMRRVAGRFVGTVDLRTLRKGVYAVTIRARTRAGRTLVGKRTYRTCAATAERRGGAKR